MEKFKKYLFYFLSFAFLGWIFEVTLNLIRLGKFMNCGTLLGPWLPIYGWGGILIVLLSFKIKKKPLCIFLSSFCICAVVEYFTSLYLELVYDTKWWNYSDLPLNLDGRTWLGGLVLFAVFSLIIIYYLIPLLDKIYDKSNKKIFSKVILILLILHIIDFCYCTFNPRIDFLPISNNITIFSEL